VLARGVEADLGPFFARDVEVVARAGEVDEVAVDVLGHAVLLLALEVLARQFVREGQPARGVDVGRFEDGVDLVFGLQALGDDFELQHADGAEQQAPVPGFRRPGSRLLRRAPASPFCSCLLLSGSRRRATRKSSGEK
jgi:hypothetical protein